MSFQPQLVLEPSVTALPSCEPNLMPFHIKYSGRAPISTYFRPRPFIPSSELEVPSGVGNPSSQDAWSGASPTAPKPTDATISVPLTQSSNENEVRMKDPNSNDGLVQLEAKPITLSVKERVQAAKRRLIGTFRGRTIHGREVCLPEGYTGVVLTTDGSTGTFNKKPSATSTTRLTRAARRKPAEVATEESEDDLMEDRLPQAMRVLRPTAQFSSMMVWNPDFQLDEGQDEYVRSLSEWVHIAALINQVEPEPKSNSD